MFPIRALCIYLYLFCILFLRAYIDTRPRLGLLYFQFFIIFLFTVSLPPSLSFFLSFFLSAFYFPTLLLRQRTRACSGCGWRSGWGLRVDFPWKAEEQSSQAAIGAGRLLLKWLMGVHSSRNVNGSQLETFH